MIQARYLDKVKELKEVKKTLKEKEFDIKNLNNINAALQTENGKLEYSLKRMYDKLQKGAQYITIRNGFIVDGGELPPDTIIIYPSQLRVGKNELTKGYCVYEDNKVIVDKERQAQYLKTFEGGIK
jgi:predicted nuclease with TOPRIM domain